MNYVNECDFNFKLQKQLYPIVDYKQHKLVCFWIIKYQRECFASEK